MAVRRSLVSVDRPHAATHPANTGGRKSTTTLCKDGLLVFSVPSSNCLRQCSQALLEQVAGAPHAS